MTLYLFQCSIDKNDFAITLSASGAGIRGDFCCEYEDESAYEYDYIEFPIKFVKSFNTDDPNEKPLADIGFKYTNKKIMDFFAEYGHYAVMYWSLEDETKDD